ncbi:TonB-dependent receptor [Pacificimonas sp. WHA3]|uniref:TonB-dependent receptor n=1 Tax=Pacificimonas pallii TaxID=2827236 RepID=A0ABS6SGD8_9SPHN|nr:TonB-dependent receptor [Pacificimonas pallii]MBV7257488.1 TonB-dependent receptor [Pacificimonas pallii]
MRFAKARNGKAIYTGLLSASVIALSTSAAAQEQVEGSPGQNQTDDAADDGGIAEIVVTAQRREQKLQDVPISISAFNEDTIEKNMFDDVGDYISQTPNASFISNGARSRRELSIRGVTNFLAVDSALRTSTFGFYVDGFSVSGSSVNPPIMDIERVEILRGPQATYFGRNAVGGGISITSNRPDNDFSGSLMADYSRFDTVDLEAVVNIPIVTDVLAARFNAKYFKTDGNIKNINPIGGGNEATYKYLKGSLRFTPTDRLTIDVIGSYVDEESGMRSGVPSGVFSTFAGDVLYASFPDRDGDGRADPDPDGVGFYPENRNRTNFNSPQSVGTEFKYVVANAEYEFDDLLLTSITGYLESDFFLAGDIDGGSGDYFNEFRETPRSSFSQELRVQNTGSGPFLWNIGVLYALDKGTSENNTFVGAAMPFGLPDGFLIDQSLSEGRSENFAVFGQVDWEIYDRLTLSFGGRYSIEKIKQDETGFSGVTVTVASIDETFKDFSPRFAIGYDVNESTRIYGTVSKGFKSGGVQVSPFPGAEAYDPETIWNYELGIKADAFDRRLRFNAAVFYMDWKDLQTTFQQAGTDPDGNLILFGGIENAEKAVSKGIELSANALVTDGLTVNASVGYLDAKYKTFVSFIDGENRVLDGRTIPNSPKWTLAADVEYAFDVNDDMEAYVRGEWNYRDSIRSSNSALIRTGFPWEVPAWDVFNMRAGIETGRYTFSVYAENLFDSNYYTNAYQKAFTGGLHIEPSFRNYGARLKVKFN